MLCGTFLNYHRYDFQKEILKGLTAKYNTTIKSNFLYMSFGWITKFSIHSPARVSVRTYKTEKTIVVKIADSKKIEIIAILFISSPSFISSTLSLAV